MSSHLCVRRLRIIASLMSANLFDRLGHGYTVCNGMFAYTILESACLYTLCYWCCNSHMGCLTILLERAVTGRCLRIDQKCWWLSNRSTGINLLYMIGCCILERSYGGRAKARDTASAIDMGSTTYEICLRKFVARKSSHFTSKAPRTVDIVVMLLYQYSCFLAYRCLRSL